MKAVLLFLIQYYRRFISMWKPPCCRFYPTCSTYALQAVAEHGALRGGFLALKRLLKCHPLHPGGYDPVPDIAARRGSSHGKCRLHGDGGHAVSGPV